MKDKENFFRELDNISKIFRDYYNDSLKKGKEFYDSLDLETKECLVAYITSILYEHAKEGGTYRYLLYERLSLENYALLQMSGLLEIHNLISGELSESEE